ncbi:MAG TPA: AAA family ATPase [Acidimicrobiia bacterium]
MLLEREGLLESLGERLRDAREGKGSLVLIAGEAGAGKTSLVRAFVETLDEETLVIQGACDPLSTPRPLSPLRDFAADPNSGLSGLAEEDKPAIEIFGEVLDRLRNTIRPILLVVEDIHWADEGTLDFLRFIGRRIDDSKAVMLCTYRDDEVGPDHPMRPVLGQLIPLESTQRVVVPPLSLAAVTTLASDHAFDPRELLRLTDGNAFFVTEILASGEGLPHTVQEAVLSRVAQLDERPRRVVEGVSVAPRSLAIEHAAVIVGGSLEDIDAALAAGVLISDGHGLRFRHELARSAVEESLPPARRLSLHMRMLAILEEEQNPDLARLAHHAVQAGRSDLIVEYAPQAGDEAVRRGSRREAVAFYRAALDHADELGSDRAAELRVKLGAELRILDEPGAAETELRRAVDHYRRSGQVESLADALGQLQGALWNLRRFDEGWQAMDEAINELRPRGPSEALGTALYRIAHHHMLARHGQLAFTHIEEARQIADEIDSDDVDWLVLMMTGCIHVVLGDADQGIRLLHESVERAKTLDNPNFLAIGLGMLGSGGGEARRYEAAIPALERGVEQGLATDADYSVAYNRSWLARIAFEQGRWDDAVGYAELVDRTTLQREGIAYITAMSALGRVRVRRGDPGGLPLLEEMTELARDHELQHGWNAICGRAEYHWLVGNPEAGSDELAPAYQRALDTDSEWARGEIGFWLWRSGAIETPPDGAAEPFALQMAGDWKGAADSWSEIGCPYETALALADGPENAKLEALAIFDSLGARPMGDRLRKVLRDLGVDAVPRGPTKETLANPGGLTNRQLEVLRLIVGGLDNTQIAKELYVSKKTVEHHVSAIYSKLGVDSRTKAVNAALEVGAVER